MYGQVWHYTYMGSVLKIFNLLFMIHTRDHGHPHVTIYKGNPESFEARAKVRLDEVEIIEASGFSKKDIQLLLKITEQNKESFLEAWNETRETK